jgi:hypothetical protein
MARKLKVYRTPIGFHDAYVAAPNQKAALKAWGADADLFARGVAELVTDESLTREPLENPGEVIRRRRGSDAENMAALPKAKKPAPRLETPADEDEGPPPRRRRSARAAPAPSRRRQSSDAEAEEDKAATQASRPAKNRSPKAEAPPGKPPARRRPARPSRAKLEEAEAALDRSERDHAGAIDAIRQEEKALQEKRRALQREHESEIEKLEAAIDRERKRYGDALAKWRE